MGDDFTDRHVLETTHGQGPMYRVSQSQGMSYVVNGDHILTLYNTATHVLEDIALRNYCGLDAQQRSQLCGCRVMGFSNDPTTLNYDIRSQIAIAEVIGGPGEYDGFVLDGNGRFLLEDRTVTHNTTELLRRVEVLTRAHKKCVVIKYIKDTRYDVSKCCTHNNKMVEAISASKLMDCLSQVEDVDVVAVDEGQFFPDLLQFCDLLADKGKLVLVAALDSRFDGLAFGQVCDLVARAETVTKLCAVCDCGQAAHFNIRIVKGSEIEQIGGSESYKAVCRKCRSLFLARATSTSTSPMQNF
jgi:thymidine kinase